MCVVWKRYVCTHVYVRTGVFYRTCMNMRVFNTIMTNVLKSINANITKSQQHQSNMYTVKYNIYDIPIISSLHGSISR